MVKWFIKKRLEVGKISIIFVLITSLVFGFWFYLGWPQIWQNPPIPSKIQEARAADCPGGWTDLGDGRCRMFLDASYPTGSNQTWSVPSNWTDTNTIECIGGGGGGATSAGGTSGASGGGGGGGAYAKSVNLTGITPSGSVTYQLGSGGNENTVGGDTWFNSSLFPSSGQACGAKGGSGGTSGSITGASGGSGTNSYAIGTGSVKYLGGTGGSGIAQAGGRAGGGGGGAAGPNGAGNYTSAQVTSTGGSGGADSGGTGGTVSNDGNPGAEYDETHGSGGGGGGGGNEPSAGMNGGLYGAAGGGGGKTNAAGAAGGAGRQGLIVVTYTPVEVVEVSIVSIVPNSFDYGSLGTSATTTFSIASSTDWIIVTNGSTAADYKIRGATTTGGTVDWVLGASASSNQYVHKFKEQADGTFKALTLENQTLKSAVTEDGIINFDLEINTPTFSTDVGTTKSVPVEVVATSPE